MLRSASTETERLDGAAQGQMDRGLRQASRMACLRIPQRSIAQRDPVRPCTECPSEFGGREIGEDAIANGRPQNWSVA